MQVKTFIIDKLRLQFHPWNGENEVHEAIYEAWILKYLNWQKQHAIQHMKNYVQYELFDQKVVLFLFKKPYSVMAPIKKKQKGQVQQSNAKLKTHHACGCTVVQWVYLNFLSL